MKNTLRQFALAMGVPVAMLAAAGQSAAATTTTPTTTVAATTPVEAYPGPTGEVPAGWSPLVDDTGAIALFVPPGWTQSDTVPAQNADGTPRPWISATTDETLFFPAEGTGDTFSAPGVIFSAAPYDADTAAVLASSVYNDTGTPGPIQSYNDGKFVGHIQAFTGVGGTATTIYQVAANPADAAFTANVLIQLTGQPDDAAILNGLLVAFHRAAPPAAG